MQQHSQHSQDGGPRARLALIVREGLKGHHLLFDAVDIDAGARADGTGAGASPRGDLHELDTEVAGEVARVGLSLARAATLDEARALVSAASTDCRSELARLYLTFLGRCASAQGYAS